MSLANVQVNSHSLLATLQRHEVDEAPNEMISVRTFDVARVRVRVPSGSICRTTRHCFKVTRNGGRSSSSSDNRSTLPRRWRTLTRGGSSRDFGTWAQVRTSHAPDEGSNWDDEGRRNQAQSTRRGHTSPRTPELHPVDEELLHVDHGTVVHPRVDVGQRHRRIQQKLGRRPGLVHSN